MSFRIKVATLCLTVFAWQACGAEEMTPEAARAAALAALEKAEAAVERMPAGRVKLMSLQQFALMYADLGEIDQIGRASCRERV